MLKTKTLMKIMTNFVTEEVDEVENKEPGETKLIKSKMKSKASVIDDDGT